MTTHALTFSESVTAIKKIDTSTLLTRRIELDPTKSHYIQLIEGQLSRWIPNVFNYDSVNTGLLRVTTDGGTSWTTIQLVNGLYTVQQIEDAITNVLASVYTSVASPAIVIRANTATNQVYMILDTTALSAGTQIGIDLAPTGSSFGTLLGFTTTTSFVTDGTKTCDAFPQLDWFGNYVSVILETFGAISNKNGSNSSEIYRINLDDASSRNTYSFPLLVQPKIELRDVTQISHWSIKLVGSRDRTLVVLEGDIVISILIHEI